MDKASEDRKRGMHDIGVGYREKAPTVTILFRTDNLNLVSYDIFLTIFLKGSA
jgi:hypothetical protein